MRCPVVIPAAWALRLEWRQLFHHINALVDRLVAKAFGGLCPAGKGMLRQAAGRGLLPEAARLCSTQGKQTPCFWVVADMDDTLIEKKPPGTKSHKTFADSPCYEPVLSWLKAGGGIMVVTTDDGHRPFGKVWASIPAELRRRVLIRVAI